MINNKPNGLIFEKEVVEAAKRFTQSRNQINIHATLLIRIVTAILLTESSVHCFIAIDQRVAEVDATNYIKTSYGNNHPQTNIENVAGATYYSNEISHPLPNKQCGVAERDLDNCSAQLIVFGQSDTQFPSSLEQLNSVYCPNVKRLTGCIRNSTNCYKPFERQVINWVITSTRRINNKRCKNEAEKQRFIRLSNSCFSLVKPSADRCMSDYVASLESISSLGPSEDELQLVMTCCANKRFKQCVMKYAKQQCKLTDGLTKLRRTNSNSSRRMVQKYIERATFNLMEDLSSTLDEMTLTGPELICKSTDEEICKAKFDGKYNVGVARYKSIVPAMLKIYSNK